MKKLLLFLIFASATQTALSIPLQRMLEGMGEIQRMPQPKRENNNNYEAEDYEEYEE